MNEKIDVLSVMDANARAICIVIDECKTSSRAESWSNHLREHDLARAAVAELIEREKVATQVFDCILRGVNDLSGPMGYRSEQFVASWMESWAKSLNAAGFKPSNPEATDIARALARIGAQS